MRLFAKIFLCATLALSMAILFSGYLLITYSYKNATDRETERALNQYQYDKFSVQAGLIANTASLQEGTLPDDMMLSDFSSDLNGRAAFFSENKTLLFSNLPVQADFSLLDGVSDDTIVHQFQNVNGINYLMVCGKLTQSGISLYLLIATDISQVVTQKELMIQSFETVYFITLGISMVLIAILSSLLTRPINKLAQAATRIAGGKYDERLSISSGDEIGVLSKNFNLMADAIEEKISELSSNARQKEDFVASFAHELKTPLTSVIGYADMLYQKNLSPEDVKNAAWYILSDGLRLEALSLKLMDLIVLNRQDFVLEEMAADEVLQNITGGLNLLCGEKEVLLHLEADPAFIRVEYDLFKTLLLNLIDNSIKAGSRDIWISGKYKDNLYCVSIKDNGRGIPTSELDRITEAFYVVDKSRSRKVHGVGLGLALAERVAQIHGSRLRFYSAENTGTTVEIDLTCEGGGAYA